MSKFDIKPINQAGSLRFINVPGNMAIKPDFGVLLYPKHNRIDLSFDLSQSYPDFDPSDQYNYLVFVTIWNDSPKTEHLCPILPITPNSTNISSYQPNNQNELFVSLILSTSEMVSKLIESNEKGFDFQHNPLILEKRRGKQDWRLIFDYIDQKLMINEKKTDRTANFELRVSVPQLITITIRRINKVELDQLTRNKLITYQHRLSKMCLCPWADSVIQELTLMDYIPEDNSNDNKLSGQISIFRPERLTFPAPKSNYTLSAWLGVIILVILIIIIFFMIWILHQYNYWPYRMSF